MNHCIIFLIFLSTLNRVANSDNTDIIMRVLSQFITRQQQQQRQNDFETTTMKVDTISGLNVLNPLNWIPIIPNNPPYNPDVELTTPEIIVRHGYQAETHTVMTEDGYLLNMHRIPCGRLGCDGERRRQPVFLQHGILASSADWVLSGPEKGIGFILADLGYDVWLSNFRGNTYSRHHVNYSTNDKEFWDFSFHGMKLFNFYLVFLLIKLFIKYNGFITL